MNMKKHSRNFQTPQELLNSRRASISSAETFKKLYVHFCFCSFLQRVCTLNKMQCSSSVSGAKYNELLSKNVAFVKGQFSSPSVFE